MTMLAHPTDSVDVINFDSIAASEVEITPAGHRRYHVGGGGYFTRSITGWVFCVYGVATTVSVPSTVLALEAREAMAVAA